MTGSPPAPARILVVDDDSSITEVLAASLSARGYSVRCADDGETALQAMCQWTPELIITDLSMPKMGGLSLCTAVRSSSNVPIIVLSVKGEEEIKVQALETGADDYVTKPFGTAELVARVRAALRRTSLPHPAPNVMKAGDFTADFAARRILLRDRELHLTPKEFELLTYLLRNADRVLTQKTLLEAIWGRTFTEQADVLRTLVRQLRKKIEDNPANPNYLKTEPWIGYRFEPGD
jgi:two-component system KDP operon response regulator KdpE